MKCPMCGCELDETKLEHRGCAGCGKHGCKQVHCPNCGFGNHPEFEEEFKFISKLKNELKLMKISI